MVTASNTIQLGNSAIIRVNTSGEINTATGFKVAGAAASGNYLRGNGTTFISGTIQASDLPASYVDITTDQTAAGNKTWTGTATFNNSTYSALFTGGNVGIGSTTPAGKLQVVTTESDGNVSSWGTGQLVVGGNGATAGALGLSYSNSANAAYISALSPNVAWKDLGLRAKNTLFYYNGTSEGMRLTSTGNVGIGTTTPAAKLDIEGGNLELSGNILLVRNNGDLNHGLKYSTGFDGPSLYGFNGGSLGYGLENASTALRWTGTGNVGIGTTSPVAKLEVASGSDKAINAYTTSGSSSQIGVLGTYNTSGYGAGIAGVGYQGTNPPASVDIGVYGSASTAGGGLAVWSNGPLKVSDGTQGAGKVLTSDANGKASWATPVEIDPKVGALTLNKVPKWNGTTLADGIVYDNGTNVGIGTTTPNASAVLDASSTSKGFLPPRMTTVQRDAIASPAAGLVIFNTNTNSLQIYNGSGWGSLITPSATAVFLPTIVIGTQQWMSKNLDVAFYRNGDPIPQVTDPAAWAALTTGAWCYYNNDPTQGNKYGKLYNWYAVIDTRGLAPQGWHIPSDAEWTTLETTLGGASVAGGKMKEPGTLNWAAPNTGADNSSGWAGLPCGGRLGVGSWISTTYSGKWWSSTDYVGVYGFFRQLYNDNGGIGRDFHERKSGWSVRCLRD